MSIHQGQGYICHGSQAQQKYKKKKKKKKSIQADIGQAKTCIGDQASEGEAESEEGEWASAGVPGSPG